MAKFDAYFALAKEKGIEVFELYYSRAKSLSFKLYNAQIEGYKLSEDISLYARGIYKGKIGYASTEKISKETASFLVDEIITNAGTVTKETEADEDTGIVVHEKSRRTDFHRDHGHDGGRMAGDEICRAPQGGDGGPAAQSH